MNQPIDIIVSGHLCLDLLPKMAHIAPEALSSPGKLFEIGALDISTGGAVSNTGLALHRLGAQVALMAGVGSDLLGQMILAFLRDRDPNLSRHIRVREGEQSSYTIVLSPQNIDRVFLHCTGTNATFGIAEIDYTLLERAKIFHLGYPPLLPRMYADEGRELAHLFADAKATGVVTSLDMSLPDRQAASGAANWWRILERTLPHVDIFVPSIDEARFVLNQGAIKKGAYDEGDISLAMLHSLTDVLFELGDMAIVGLKLGEQGMYLRSGSAESLTRLRQRGVALGIAPGTHSYHPAFDVVVAGTTGAGDAAYGALLLALLRGFDLADCARWMCAIGACNVEAADATSGVRSWDQTQQRMDEGWQTVARSVPET
ncbi:MAG: carbohydrate kinase family protein [Chloroflexota bacterium]|nr:carbohydrate kinase family protein [Chloroflexota bacterium]